MQEPHQVGTRQATRSRTRTRQAQHQPGMQSLAGPSRTDLPRHHSEDHPLSPQKLAAKGYHAFQCLGVPFHVKRRYAFVRELGIGAYGCVALAHDTLLDCNVAIKKVTRIFEREVLARRALREVAVLRHTGLCDNVTALLDFDTTFIEFNEIYLVLEASEADLSQIIRSGQALSDAHLQYFVAQILRGVRYMHTAKIIHRDLKPGNLLVNGDCQLKLCDFGLARAYKDAGSTPPAGDTTDGAVDAERAFPESPEVDRSSPASPSMQMTGGNPGRIRTTALDFPGGPLTEYVATRWYRAPEIMLCFRMGYGSAIDIWSVGCILAELLCGKPIFAGKDYVDQIARINNVLGSPSASTVDKIGSERARTYVESLPSMPAVPFSKLYPKASPLAIDLLSKMLVWDPEERITASEALQHPWLKAYHKSNSNWEAPTHFSRFDEVEMLHTMEEFRMGLEREADEMRAELEALEADETRGLDDASVSTSQRDSSSSDPDASGEGAPTREDKADKEQNPSSGDQPHSSSNQQDERSHSNTNAFRSAESDGVSPVATPMTFTSSINETSPLYETDLTSASAPHSVAGSNSFGSKRTRLDGLGLISHVGSSEVGSQDGAQHDRAACQALDETLANHGLLHGDEKSRVDKVHDGRRTFRRRAVSNAPSQAMTLRRHGSEGNLRQLLCGLPSLRALEEASTASSTVHGDASPARSAGAVPEGAASDGSRLLLLPSSSSASVHEALRSSAKTTDIIRRPLLQREGHQDVADDAGGLLRWLTLSSSPWQARRFTASAHTLASDTTTVGFQNSPTRSQSPGPATTHS